MKKLLVTGGSGFIGRNVLEYLKNQNLAYEIHAPSSMELDCLDETQVTEYLKRHRFDEVLHFAVYSDRPDNQKEQAKLLEYNLRIFFNFAKNADLFGKMYYAGSGAEYDKRSDISNVTEAEFGNAVPVDPYGLMKYTIGRAIEQSTNIYNFRLFGIFGKYEYYPAKFISNICCKAIKGLPLSIRQDLYFDYLWVEDFSRMVEYFLFHEPKHHTYNLTSGSPCRYVLDISKKDLPVYICREGLGKEYTASNQRFLKECPQFQFTPLKDAVKRLYHWYEKEEIDLLKLLY